MFYQILLTLISYHVGAFVFDRPRFPIWVVEFAAVGFLLSAVAANFAGDYYRYRRGLAPTWSAKMQPPQLMLKGVFAAYLLAFLFALIVMLNLREKGWVLAFPAFSHALLGYYHEAPAVSWARRRFRMLCYVVYFVIPMLTGMYL